MLKNGPLCKYLSRANKLVLLIETSLLVIETSKEKYMSLERVPYIYYLLRFWIDTTGIKVLVDLGNKVNAMTPAYAAKLGLKVRKTNIKA